MRILITTTGENIFTEDEKQNILDKKFRSTTTNKRYLKKLTIEKIPNKHEKKQTNTKPKNKNYFIPAGIAYKPDDFFSKTTSTFYPKTIRIATDLKNEDKYDKYRRIRINMKKIVFPKVLQTKYELDKIQQKTENDFMHNVSCSIDVDKRFDKNISLTPIKGIITLEDLIEFLFEIPIFDEEDYESQHKNIMTYSNRKKNLSDTTGNETMDDKLNKLYDSDTKMKQKDNNNEITNKYYGFKDGKGE